VTKDRKTVVVGVTGSIAAYRACDIVGALRKSGVDVNVVLTKEAQEFVSALTFRTLSGNKVACGMFDTPEEWDPSHISLAQKADLVLVAPASANIIGKLASGVCDDLLTCVIFATKSPVLIAPAMNMNMYEHRIVQQNISKLKSLGYIFVGPVKGRLACGAEGIGHIASTDDIIKESQRLLK
jgi:phosphopantothenoylcysteine decarboxylase/phosphopantothenate--cysteine ligase